MADPTFISVDAALAQSASYAAALAQYTQMLTYTQALFLDTIRRDPCLRPGLFAELAEWLTETVASSEPEGCPYSRLLSEASRLYMVSPSDVEGALDRLGLLRGEPLFVAPETYSEATHEPRVSLAAINKAHGTLRDDHMVRLPAGHPLRKD